MSSFPVDSRNSAWINRICKECNYKRNSENLAKDPVKRMKWRRWWNWKRQGVNDPDKALELMLVTKACQLCGETEKVLHLDHNHATGNIRGVLCTTCNLGLGAFKDNPSLMRKAAAYVEGNRYGQVVYN